jgi:hypothetical protein
MDTPRTLYKIMGYSPGSEATGEAAAAALTAKALY